MVLLLILLIIIKLILLIFLKIGLNSERKVKIMVSLKYFRNLWRILNSIQDGPFRGCSRMRGMSDISYTDETWHDYTLPEEDPNNI